MKITVSTILEGESNHQDKKAKLHNVGKDPASLLTSNSTSQNPSEDIRSSLMMHNREILHTQGRAVGWEEVGMFLTYLGQIKREQEHCYRTAVGFGIQLFPWFVLSHCSKDNSNISNL